MLGIGVREGKVGHAFCGFFLAGVIEIDGYFGFIGGVWFCFVNR